MAIDATQFGTDLGHVINDLPATAVVSGVTVNVSASEITRDQAVNLSGEMQFAEVEIHLRSNLIPATPKEGDRVLLRGVGELTFTPYRVAGRVSGHESGELRISLNRDKRETYGDA